MKFLVDTSVMIDVLAGNPAAVAWYQHYQGSPLFVSTLSLVEMETGFHQIREPAPQRRALATLLRRIKPLPFGIDEAREAGRIIARLGLGGKQTGYTDSLLAAQAKQGGLTIATSNKADFVKIPGLKVFPVSKK